MLQKEKQQRLGRGLVWFILAVSLSWAVLTQWLKLPDVVMFVIDGAWCVLALLLLLQWREILDNRKIRPILLMVLLFMASTIIGLVLQYQSIWYYIWGIRNNFGYLIFFVACLMFLRKEDVDLFFKSFDILFAINFLVTLYQYFALGYKQDYLGGIFGVVGGCNQYTNAFMLIVITNSMVRYLNQKEKSWVCLLKCAAALFIAALAELKMFILEFGVLLVLAVLMTKFSRRKIYLLVGGAIGAVVSIRLLVMIFPGWANWFTLESIWKTATSAAGYNGHGVEVNRLTAIPIAWNTYLTTWPQKLFGLGLGHCDYSSLSFLITPFYQNYGHILYTYFQSGFLMLETGAVGVILYCSIFVTEFFIVHWLEKKEQAEVELCQLVKIMALMCLILFVYNATLRGYSAYMMFVTLALPFIENAEK